MEYNIAFKDFAKRIKSIRDNIQTEEATKTSIIMPFFQLLGYDVFNPSEFTPEFTADVGIKKGEKVDYAILENGQPLILIEAKCINEELNKHDSQLFRYFGTCSAKFAILTNGIIYKFFTDLDAPNKMDSSPFLELNIMDLKDYDISELMKFHKTNFNVNEILDTASELKYSSALRGFLKKEFNTPSDEFVRFLLGPIYEGVKTQNVVEKFRPVIKKSISLYINDLVNEKIKNALSQDDENASMIESNADEKNIAIETLQDFEMEDNVEDGIITTDEELESLYIIKSIIRKIVPANRIAYKDTLSYFAVLLDGKVTRWICRIFLKDNIKYIIIPGQDKTTEKYIIEALDDLYKLEDKLIRRCNELL